MYVVEQIMKVYMFVADGFECVEALAPIDVMNRAGVELKRVAVGGSLDVCSSHGLVSLRCDMLVEDADLSDGDAIILPGGNPGYVNLRSSELVCDAVRTYYNSGRLVAAICGAPTVLAMAGVAHGCRVRWRSITMLAARLLRMETLLRERVLECRLSLPSRLLSTLWMAIQLPVFVRAWRCSAT